MNEVLYTDNGLEPIRFQGFTSDFKMDVTKFGIKITITFWVKEKYKRKIAF